MQRSAKSTLGHDSRFDNEKALTSLRANGRPRAAAYYNLFTLGQTYQIWPKHQGNNMVTATLPNERESGKGATVHPGSTNSSPSRKPTKALPGNSNNRLDDTLPSKAADVIAKRNGKAASRARSSNGRSKGHQNPPDTDNVQTAAGAGSDGRVQKWKICDLKPFHLQGDFFPAESAEADCELAADMKQNGQKTPIDILPDGTIVGGHRRTEAAKRLGWKEIDAVVRHNLVGNEKAIEAEFLKDNCLRRQLSPLQRARCAKRLIELANEGKLTFSQEANVKEKTRDKVGRLLGLSGRQVGRLLRVLKTSLEVQLAYDAGKLHVETAGRVEDLPQHVQKQIAAKIRERGVECAKAIIDSHLPKKAESRKGANKLAREFIWALRLADQELSGHVEKVTWLDKKDLPILEAGERIIGDLKRRIEEMYEDEDEDEDEDEWCEDVT